MDNVFSAISEKWKKTIVDKGGDVHVLDHVRIRADAEVANVEVVAVGDADLDERGGDAFPSVENVADPATPACPICLKTRLAKYKNFVTQFQPK